MIDLPALEPLAVKFSYLHDESKSWRKNLIGGERISLALREPSFNNFTYADNLGSKNVDAFQVAARLDFKNDLMIDYHFDYTDSKTSAAPVQVLGHNGSLKGVTELVFSLQPLYGGINNLGTKPLPAVANSTSDCSGT